MLNCIPRYENTKGQAEGSGFKEQTTDTSMHQCTIAKMYQCTNELFQEIISQILRIKYQNTERDDSLLLLYELVHVSLDYQPERIYFDK